MRYGITFWTEGGGSVGMKHIERCISLAAEVSALGIPVNFIVNGDSAVERLLDAAGFFHLSYQIDGMHAPRLAEEVVVIDTDRDVTRQIKRLKENGRKVAVVGSGGAAAADAALRADTSFESDDERRAAALKLKEMLDSHPAEKQMKDLFYGAYNA